ncbi:hypothetical protein CS022_11885 [Veronia nyctiphanis]|uniref:SPOR domain-containing protein n=1 Tax=Veronia nyctiphanis TaxID=1278244 RepID=A0A4V1LSV3_9GAMM|nr:hypothetical protein [Veronia nyctiphanis]RXJ72998.1 hypothetical protein CS022_11885 [Veronia nyctiphanis]
MFRVIFLTIALLGFSFSVNASPSCQASEGESGWLMLSSDCDVGEGLWGRTPSKDAEQFWVQCSMTDRVPPPWFAQLLRISLDNSPLFLRKESELYRCLVGPFDDFRLAMDSRDRLRQLHPWSETSFIRQLRTEQESAEPEKGPATNEGTLLSQTR